MSVNVNRRILGGLAILIGGAFLNKETKSAFSQDFSAAIHLFPTFLHYKSTTR